MAGMTGAAWDAFDAARARFRKAVADMAKEMPRLGALQQDLVNSRSGPAYTVETPVVYNAALDDIQKGDTVALILVGDNPGRREQAAENRRYLVGPSGKIAERFFQNNPALGIDFRKNVIILNKTPVHTPRTVELAELGPAADLIVRSQRTMASLLLEFQKALSRGRKEPVPVWITGYSEMKDRGIFEIYRNSIISLYESEKSFLEKLFIYRHFSMNQFTIDLRQKAEPGESIAETLERIGTDYRRRVLGK